jgi:hypothetical protein
MTRVDAGVFQGRKSCMSCFPSSESVTMGMAGHSGDVARIPGSRRAAVPEQRLVNGRLIRGSGAT